MEFLKILLTVVIIAIIGILAGILLYYIIHKTEVANYYNSDYTCIVTVDKSERIDQAISNSIEDVKSRNFKLIGLEVKRISDGTKKIICKGITEANLIKED